MEKEPINTLSWQGAVRSAGAAAACLHKPGAGRETSGSGRALPQPPVPVAPGFTAVVERQLQP